MKTNIGMTEEALKAVGQDLSHLLADEYLLYTKTRNAHWNVEGSDFHAVHRFFKLQYAELDGILDGVAERIRSLGHYAPATLSSFLQLTHLTEAGREKNDSASHIRELLHDHESIIIQLRGLITRFAEKWHDLGTSDYITGLMETHEKMAWMLRAHLRS